MPGNWSRAEVEATVADYLAMLTAELKGERYSKTEHRRRLSRLLDGRSDPAIERKHMNISAILLEQGLPYVDGYKPLGNYQALLFDSVGDRVRADRPFLDLVEHSVSTPAGTPMMQDILSALEDPPEPSKSKPYAKSVKEHPAHPPIDYLAWEASNASLGAAGEEFVVRFECARLTHAGRENLADRIEHVSHTIGDHVGFDIRSFENDGSDRFVEVKTTGYGKETPFYLTRNEVRTSQEHAARYHLYRLFRFRLTPGLFTLRGALEQTCVLHPVTFVAETK